MWSRMSKGLRIALVVVGVAVAFAVVGALLPEVDDPADAAPPTATAEATPEPTTEEVEPVAEPTTEPDTPDLAASVRQAALDGLGVAEFTETCAWSPPGWGCYLADVKAVGSSTVVLRLQVDRDDTATGERAALAVFNFAGPTHEDLSVVQAVSADGSTLATLRRGDVPLLR